MRILLIKSDDRKPKAVKAGGFGNENEHINMSANENVYNKKIH